MYITFQKWEKLKELSLFVEILVCAFPCKTKPYEFKKIIFLRFTFDLFKVHWEIKAAYVGNFLFV